MPSPRLAALILCLAGAAGAANGPMPTTMGARGPISMPIDGDGQTIFRMPSGIGWNLEHRIDLDLFFAMTSGTVENSLNDFEETSWTPGARR